MALDRNLKAYSRVDGMGRVVPGSTILRKQKPKNGTWFENKTYECCNTITLSYTVANVAISDIDFQIYCGETLVFFNYTGQTSVTATDLLNILNNYVSERFPALGTFSTPDVTKTTNVVFSLTISSDLAKIFCPYKNGLSFTITAD